MIGTGEAACTKFLERATGPRVNAFLWILQILLALLFLGTGITKTTRPKDKLAGMMTWSRTWSPQAIKALGTAELLGAIGLVLPWATNIAPVLTPVAAVGLSIVMVGANVVHIRAKEYNMVPVTVVILALAVVVAAGRF
jgi:uncharacterized membrane protein YphA (DoxX/SURF4 family)